VLECSTFLLRNRRAESLVRYRQQKVGVADFEYESAFIPSSKPRLKLTFECIQSCYSYLDSATPKILNLLPQKNRWELIGIG
jgi:hypothetical protein